jgi:hypothetical protein
MTAPASISRPPAGLCPRPALTRAPGLGQVVVGEGAKDRAPTFVPIWRDGSLDPGLLQGKLVLAAILPDTGRRPADGDTRRAGGRDDPVPVGVLGAFMQARPAPQRPDDLITEGGAKYEVGSA